MILLMSSGDYFHGPHKVVALGTAPPCSVTKGPRATWLWLWSLLSPLCPKTFQWDIYAQRTEPNSFTSWDGSQVSTAQHLSALLMGLSVLLSSYHPLTCVWCP